MNKMSKILFGILITIVAIIIVGGLVSVLSGPSAQMGGYTWHIGDKIKYEAYNKGAEINTTITSINEYSMHSVSKDGKWVIMWNLKTGEGDIKSFDEQKMYDYYNYNKTILVD